MNYPHPKNHIIVKQRLALDGGATTIIPVLYLSGGETKRVEILVDYFLDNIGMSEQWMRYRARAMGLFFDYCTSLPKESTSPSHPLFHKRLVRGFLISLLNGTIDETGRDNLGLYWPSTGIDVVKRLCTALHDVIHYSEQNDLVPQNLLNRESYSIPHSEQTAISFLHIARRIKGYSFLSHVINVQHLARKLHRSSESSGYNLQNSTSKSQTAPKRFPEELIDPLFKRGFMKNDKAPTLEEQEDIVGKMCCLLWLFAGLRKDEPLHLWVTDIVYVQGHGLKVVQRHPSDSSTHIVGENMTRKEYLKRIGRLPRNEDKSKSQRAGWKNLSLDKDNQAYVYFMHKGAEQLFLSMYHYYINNVRPKRVKALTDSGKPDHPFLFVSSGVDRNSGKSYVGEPYSSKSLDDSFSSALNRVEKDLGIQIVKGKKGNTNPHAMRHFYIGKLKDANVDPLIVQKTVKHGSIESQNAYDAPTQERIQSVMDDVQLQLSDTRVLE